MNYLYNNRPELYARDVLFSLNLTPPIDINEICEMFDIKINYENIKTAEALIIISPGKKNIVINENRIRYLPRQRFTIAHEIGHLFIPWHKNQYSCSKIRDFNPLDIHENEADIFASELLIPMNSMLSKIDSKSITLELMKELSQEYNVSLSAMARKVIENTDDQILALVYYNNGNKVILSKSKKFDFSLKPGIIKASAARTLLASRYGSESMKRILNCNIWFQENNNDSEIVEESLYQPNLNRVFTILRIANDMDYLDAFFDQ